MESPNQAIVEKNISEALLEDNAANDITAKLIPPTALTHAHIVCRENAILCGSPWAETAFRQLDPDIQIQWNLDEGDVIKAGRELCQLSGNSRAILSAERTALNFLQTLSATATRAHLYAQTLTGSKTKILDTRKTLPGLRYAQKYAVRCGSCHNHRSDLSDAFLIKENHIIANKGIKNTIQRARHLHPDKFLEIEVETIAQLIEAIDEGVDCVMLDNFLIDDIKKAVELCANKAKLEVSGNLLRNDIEELAKLGIDRISVGDLTKNISAIDLSLRFL